MEIPESVQAVLRCGECDELLSCGPVFLVHDTNEAICGRCSHQSPKDEKKQDLASTSHLRNRSRSRNVQYEAAARLLAFPCRYSNEGCHEKLNFSEGEPNIHERDCAFRKFFCPIMARECGWVGSRLTLSDHCKNTHATHFCRNPFVLPRPDLVKSSLSNFLVFAFEFLFLVHVKVCATSGKLFHAVRFLGDSKLLDQFSYSLEIKGNGSKLTEENSVQPPGTMILQQPTAKNILISNLCSILGSKYNESEFKITIQIVVRKCLNCLRNFKDVSGSEFCDECRRKLLKCNNGCLFKDFYRSKCGKHENMFCEYQRKCSWCKMNFNCGSFIKHLSSSTSHKTLTASINSVVRVTRNTPSNFDFILFASNYIGTIICEYKLTDSNLTLYLYTSLASHELKNYKCSIALTDLQTKHTQIFTPQHEYNKWDDWSINEGMSKFPSCEYIGVDMKININKI